MRRIFSTLLLAVVSFGLSAEAVFASASDGTIDPQHHFAWSEGFGWLNFAADQSNIHVTDSTLTGYIWSQNGGWINLAPTNGGVMNDGEGHLSGSAWAAMIGWRSFQGITIDAQGYFHGVSQSVNGDRFTFDCDSCSVRTDWRPVSVRSTGSGGGTSGSAALLVGTDITVTMLSATSVKINWDTAAAAHGTVYYGVTTSYNNSVAELDAVTHHEARLTDLAAGTTYHYEICSTDGTGNQSCSYDLTFAIPAALPSPVPSAPPGAAYDPAQAAASAPTIDINEGWPTAAGASAPCASGSLLKLANDHDPATADDTTVWYCGTDGKRHAFFNSQVFHSWYTDFSSVQIVDPSRLSAIPIGSQVRYRPGIRMIQTPSDPRVYVVAQGGVVRWVENEATARLLYGTAWNTFIDDISNERLAAYTIGLPIISS